MIKILHIADLHLDSPFSLCDERESEARRNELRAAFLEAVAFAQTQGVRYVLIAGDLFDDRFTSSETVRIVTGAFADHPEIRFILAPGNHDPYTEGSPYALTDFPENVRIFRSEELRRFSFEDDGVDIYGYAFEGPSLTKCPFTGKRPEREDRFNLLIAHGDTSSPISRYCPITKTDIEQFGAAYTALGHIHNTSGIETLPDGRMFAYSGCLLGRSFDECGTKGAILVCAENGKVTAEFHPFSKHQYEKAELDFTGTPDAVEATATLRAYLRDRGFGEETILRVVAKGSVPAPLFGDPVRIRASLPPIGGLEIVDRTVPDYHGDTLQNDPTIRGELYRVLLPKLTGTTPEEREDAARALRYGLSALSGDNIVDF